MSQVNQVTEEKRKEVEPRVVCKRVSVEGLDAVIAHYLDHGYELKAVVPGVYKTIHQMTMSTAASHGTQELESVLVVLVKKVGDITKMLGIE